MFHKWWEKGVLKEEYELKVVLVSLLWRHYSREFSKLNFGIELRSLTNIIIFRKE